MKSVRILTVIVCVRVYAWVSVTIVTVVCVSLMSCQMRAMQTLFSVRTIK